MSKSCRHLVCVSFYNPWPCLQHCKTSIPSRCTCIHGHERTWHSQLLCASYYKRTRQKNETDKGENICYCPVCNHAMQQPETKTWMCDSRSPPCRHHSNFQTVFPNPKWLGEGSTNSLLHLPLLPHPSSFFSSSSSDIYCSSFSSFSFLLRCILFLPFPDQCELNFIGKLETETDSLGNKIWFQNNWK